MLERVVVRPGERAQDCLIWHAEEEANRGVEIGIPHRWHLREFADDDKP